MQIIDSRIIVSRQLTHRSSFVRVLCRQIPQGLIRSSTVFNRSRRRLRRNLTQFLCVDEKIRPKVQFFAPDAAESQSEQNIALTPNAPIHSFNCVQHDAPTFYNSSALHLTPLRPKLPAHPSGAQLFTECSKRWAKFLVGRSW